MLITLITAVSTVFSPNKNHATTGATNIAIIAPSEEMRVILITDAHTAIKITPNSQFKPKNAPIAVATPLPPLKLKNNGNIWPNKVASITPPITQIGKFNNITNNVGKKPLQPSPSKVMIAGTLPPMRNTFVAPGLLEPWLRGSGKPHILQTMMALDNDPIKYAAAINNRFMNIFLN